MALVAISALPASTVITSTDVLPFVRGGTTDKITAGNFRTQIFAFNATDPLNCGALTAVGSSTITGALSGITTLTATTGVFSSLLSTAATAVTVTLNTTNGATTDNTTILFQRGGTTKWREGTNISGTNNDAFEIYNETATVVALSIANATRLVTFSNGLTLTAGALTFGAAASQVVPGATSLSLRNNANNADNLIILDAGGATFRAGVTATTFTGAGALTTLTVSSTITMSAAASQVIPGGTSLSFRNNANNADNILILDAGDVTIRRLLICAAGTTFAPSIRLPHGAAPTSPNDGDMWSTTAGAFIRVNGVTKTFTLT